MVNSVFGENVVTVLIQKVKNKFFSYFLIYACRELLY